MTRLTSLVVAWAALTAGCRGTKPVVAPSAPAATLALGPELATDIHEVPAPPRPTPSAPARGRGRTPTPPREPTGQISGEAALSPDGHWWTFASHRGTKVELLSENEAAAFARDPNAFDDIYVQRTDGGGLRRLTRDAGQNLEPSFRRDGKQIVFTHRAGEVSELYTVDVTGEDVRQVTRLDAVTGRAVYHPGGDYLAFTSRTGPGQPAGVMVIDRLGRYDAVLVAKDAKDLAGDVRVGFEAGGDSIWWTTLDAAGSPVRRFARFNDRLARRRLGQKPLPPPATAGPRAWVSYFSDPYFEGRATGSPREVEYVEAVAAAFRDLGLKPVGERFVLPFSFVTEVTLGDRTELELQVGEAAEHLALSGDFIPTSYSADGEFNPAPVVFAGYGLVADAEAPEPAFDSYGTLDVQDRWVAIFDGLPARLSGSRRFFLHQHGRLLERVLNAQLRGAAGVLVIDDPSVAPVPLRLRTEGRPDGVHIPVLRLSRRQGERLFADEKSSVAEWAKRLAAGDVATLIFTRASARARIDLHFKSAVTRNVVGMVSVPGATRSILIGAHLDGPGRGERGGSLDAKPDVIHPAANDNATGLAALIRLAGEVRRRSADLKQNVIFAAWSGTELGLLGSKSFARRTPRPTAVLNLVALGADRRQVTARGLATSANWTALLDGLKLTATDSLGPDDAGSFADVGVPALTLTAGAFAEDHTSADVPERVNFTVVDQIIEFTKTLLYRLGQTPEPAVFIRSRDRAG